uniref:Uncharacterized protein n=1 Tax=Elaeophora elaphi TaxID=1147741 RepID=A0A0R3S0F5_9BILA
MKLLEHKQRELQRISNEIQRLLHGNPQQQRKCARLKILDDYYFQEDHERLKQEIQKLQENMNKDEKRLEELRKQIEANERNDGRKNDFQKEYEELRKMLGVGKELNKEEEKADDSSDNTLSFKTDENIYLDKQNPEVKPIQNDQYGVYEQVKNIKTVEERMLKRKKIESEAEEAFTIGMASLCEIEADIDSMKKRLASPIVKLEMQIDKIDKMREICVTAIAELNLTTKRMLFDLMGFVVNILRNALYIIARIRDSLVYYTESKTEQ